MNLRLGPWSRILAPGYSWCEKCGTPWRFVQGHTTWYIQSSPDQRIGAGIFPLCEKCWAALTPEQRLPFYRSVWSRWPDERQDDWVLVERAVLAGR